MSGENVEGGVTPRLLLVGAVGFFEAAEGLDVARRAGGLHHWPSQAVNVGFAFELALKAFCLHHGATEKDLRALGHDLVALLGAAEKSGFQPPANAVEVVKLLGPNFLDHSIRYLRGVTVELPIPEIMLPAAHATVQGVGNQIGIDKL